MKPLLPSYCRPLGYVLLAFSVFAPFILLMGGWITDANLIFMKECIKLLMIFAALFILLAINKNESKCLEKVRITAMRRAVYITVVFIFGSMLYHVAAKDITSSETSTFLIFLLFNVICLEFGVKCELMKKNR